MNVKMYKMYTVRRQVENIRNTRYSIPLIKEIFHRHVRYHCELKQNVQYFISCISVRYLLKMTT